MVNKVRGLQGDALLTALLEQYEKHKRYSRWLSNIFAYMVRRMISVFFRSPFCFVCFDVIFFCSLVKDRTYAKTHSLKPLSEATMNSFRVLVFDRVRDAAIETALDMVSRQRRGDAVAVQLLATFVSVCCCWCWELSL